MDLMDGRPDTMIYWLGEAVGQLRRQKPGVSQAQIAKPARVDQSLIWRLEEERRRWPQKIELVIAGYAELLEVDGREIWKLALDLWAEHGQAPSVAGLGGEPQPKPTGSPIENARQAFELTLLEQAQQPEPKRPRKPRKSPAKRNPRAKRQDGGG